MRVRTLGCSGSIAAGCRTTAFLVDDDVLLDAGSGVGDLDVAEMAAIDRVLLSHSHLDHVLGLPLLADTVVRERLAAGRPLVVQALPATIRALRAHVFNDTIWPDFTRLPSPERPLIAFEPLAVGDVVDLGRGRRVRVLPAQHTVPAAGFALLGETGSWAFSGDTAAHEDQWSALAALDPPLHRLVVEATFVDDDAWLADASQHLHPSALADALAGWRGGALDVHVTHMKPGRDDAIWAELLAAMRARGLSHRLHRLAAGDTFEIA